ncbi:MAG TPA: extracellular solute-binding protein [Symbiobacteriaceae bacterium]|nr:extracellular solute-binding protein [Symbiobacteriaceae bacterium]
MKRKPASLLVLSTVLALLLSACGGAKETPAPAAAAPQAQPEQQQPVKQTKLTWWTYNRHDMDFMKAEIEKFNKENKHGIEIEYVIHSDNFPQMIDLAFQSKQAPDIYLLHANNWSAFLQAGRTVPLEPYFSPEKKAEWASIPRVEGSIAKSGVLNALPMYTSTSRLVYNVDLFEKAGLTRPPKTLDEMVAYAKKITEVGKVDGAYGFSANMKSASSAINRSLLQQARLGGVNYYNFADGKYDFTGYKPYVDAWKQMWEDGSWFPGTQSLDIDPLRSQFAEGKIGMYMSISAEAGVYANQFKPKMKWAVAPMPTATGEALGTNSLNLSSPIAISSQSEHKDLAWKVVDYFTSKDFVTRYQAEGLGIALLPGVKADQDKFKIKELAWFAVQDTDMLWPGEPTIKLEGKGYADVFASVIYGQTSMDDAIADLNKRYNTALEKVADKPVIAGWTPKKK